MTQKTTRSVNTVTEQQTILAIDPGLMTGIAIYDNDELTLLELDIDNSYKTIHDLIVRGRPGAVVIESFRITAATAKNTQAPWSLELIGATRLCCQLVDVPLALQAPGEAKGFGTDEKLKAMGWYNPTKGNHQNDAARHLLVFLVKAGWWDDRLARETR